MYDAVQERIAAYEQEIVRQLDEMEREEQTGPNGAASVEHQQGKDDQTTRTGGEAPGVAE